MSDNDYIEKLKLESSKNLFGDCVKGVVGLLLTVAYVFVVFWICGPRVTHEGTMTQMHEPQIGKMLIVFAVFVGGSWLLFIGLPWLFSEFGRWLNKT